MVLRLLSRPDFGNSLSPTPIFSSTSKEKFDFTRRFVNKKAFTKGKIIDFSEIQKNRNKRGYVCWKRDHRKVSPAGPARREGSVGLPEFGEKKDKKCSVYSCTIRPFRAGKNSRRRFGFICRPLVTGDKIFPQGWICRTKKALAKAGAVFIRGQDPGAAGKFRGKPLAKGRGQRYNRNS